MHAQQHRGALLDRRGAQPSLGRAGEVDRDPDVAGRRQREHREGRPGHRRAGDLLAAVTGRHDPGGERSDPGRVHGIRCEGIGLGVRDDFGHYRRVTTSPRHEKWFASAPHAGGA